MTVTVKKRKFGFSQEEGDADFGQKYHCDTCAKDISHLLRIKCATCPDYDTCIDCFAAGVETADHKNNHPYKVFEILDFPLFELDWGADEELLLVEGLEIFGVGNWEQISEHIGSKTKTQVAEHYEKVYVQSEAWPSPDMSIKFKKEAVRRSARGVEHGPVKPIKIPRPPASQPTIHDIQGFMPGRNEFEVELENDAETHVGAMEFNELDTPEEVELKCCILNIYNTSLSRRLERKKFIHDKNLLDFRRIQGIEKKRPKEEKEILQKVRVFEKMLTEKDFATFVQGLLNETKTRTRIAQLQEARRMGLLKLSEANVYEKDKASRAANKALGYNPYQYEKPIAMRMSGSRHKLDDSSAQSSPRSTPGPTTRKIYTSLDISQAESVELLSLAERDLCSNIRVFPKAYLMIKDMLLREYTSKKVLNLGIAKTLLGSSIDSKRITRIFEFICECGWVKPVLDLNHF